MEPSPPGRSPPTAWQPFTFGGVAAFASPSFGWLAVLLLLTGAFLGWGVVSYLESACYPAVETAIPRLPAQGAIHQGKLAWPTNGVLELANTRLFSLVVNPAAAPVSSQPADVALEVTDRALTAQSLLGYWVLPYPVRAQVPLNRAELEPLWAAWRPHVRVVLPVTVVVGLLLAWVLLATLAAPLLRLAAGLLRRDVTLAGCWRMALAALVPAGCGTAFGLVLYASRAFHLLDTLIAWLLVHMYTLVLWTGAVISLPRRVPASPFVGETPPPTSDQGEAAAVLVPPPVPERSPFAEPQPSVVHNPFAGMQPDPRLPEPPSLPVSVLARPRPPARVTPPVAPAPTESTPPRADEDPPNPS